VSLGPDARHIRLRVTAPARACQISNQLIELHGEGKARIDELLPIITPPFSSAAQEVSGQD
jgi:hypothetical protein